MTGDKVDLQHPTGLTATLLWMTIVLATTALLTTAGIIYFLVVRRSWRDTSWKIRRLAPKKVKKEKVIWLQPYQYLSRLPEMDYIRASNGEELHVPLLPDEALYANMTLNLSSYYSRVYAFDSCTDQDVILLQQSLRRALGAYPILAGRCRRHTKRKISVVLPVECLLSEDDENAENVLLGAPQDDDEEEELDIPTKDSKKASDDKDTFVVGRKRTCGVPFRVLHVLPEDPLNTQIENHELTPLDVGRYSMYEDQHRIVKGHAPLLTITLYRFQKSGKAVLTLTVSHGVMDGSSMARFEALWAKESHILAELDPPTIGETKVQEEKPEDTQRTTTSSNSDSDDESHQSDPTKYTIFTLPPVETVVPVSRQELPPAYETMEEYKAAQMEFLGEIIDGYGRDIRGNCIQKLMGWIVIELGLPLLKVLHDGLYLLGVHPNLHRPVISLSQEHLQQFKETATPTTPGEWVATNDALAAVLVKKVVELKQSRGAYKKHRARIVLWRDSRGYLQQDPLHAYGMGMFMFPFVIDEPHTKSASEIALMLRRRLHQLQIDPELAVRFWRMNTTVLSLRLWAFLPYVTSLYDFRRSDVLILLNNSTFPLPHFAGTMGCATSTTTQAGPSVLQQAQQEEDGAAGCRLILDEDIKKVLKPKILLEWIASAQQLKSDGQDGQV